MRTARTATTALALLAIPWAGVGAQTAVGVVAGLSRATFVGGGASSVNWQTGFLLGGVAEVPLSDNWSLRPELHYATKGSYVRALPSDPRDQALFLSYVQLPILVQLETGRPTRFGPRLFGGVSVAATVTCKHANAGCGDVVDLDLRAYDAGVVVGAEAALARFGVGVRYEAGLTPVLSAEVLPEFTHGALSFTVRYDVRGR